jgi:hypothetical protein
MLRSINFVLGEFLRCKIRGLRREHRNTCGLADVITYATYLFSLIGAKTEDFTGPQAKIQQLL